MKSVRLTAAQEARLRDAAARSGVTESELIRRAVDRTCSDVLDGQTTLFDRLDGLIGVGRGGGRLAQHSSDAFGDLLAEERARSR